MPPGTLRMWESRYAFPRPARLPGGHRRYPEREVERVLEVARLRDQGLSMPAAIAQVQRASEHLPASVFAGLQRRLSGRQAAVLPKRALLEISHAIEDEYCARAADGLLVACFQRERFYRSAERRWADLARTTRLAVAMADFGQLREVPDRPIEVPIDIHQPLAREWSLIIDAPSAQACVAGWEEAAASPQADSERRFEVLWSFEPAVVRTASEVAIEVLGRFAPAVAERATAALVPVAGAATELRFASALAHRIVSYLVTAYEG